MTAILDENNITREELSARTGWSLDKIAFMLSGHGKVEFGEVCIFADAVPMERELAVRDILGWHARRHTR